MTNNAQLLKIAQKHIGQGGAVFRKYCGLPAGAAWCNAFVDYIAHEGGVSALYFNGKKETYCPHSISWCKKNLAQVPLYWAIPCDVIYFDWDRNGVPNHIGLVRAKNTTSSIYTIEGNTDGGKVAQKTRAGKYVLGVYRPFFSAKFNDKALEVDGSFSFQSVGGLQKALKILGYYSGQVDTILGPGTVKALQKFVGVNQDAAIGPATVRAIQKRICGFTGKAIDGEAGPATTKAIQRWINANAYQKKPAATKPAAPSKPATPAPVTNAQKIVNKANELAWPYGTPSSKWDYKKGSPTAKCKAAMNKLGYSTKEKWSDCGRFATTVVRESGVDPGFVAMKGVKDAFPKSAKFNIVLSGKRIPSGFLKAGDIVRYKKTKGQHTLIYMGNNRVCEARHYKRFGNIVTDEKRYNKKSTKAKSIQVLRAR